MKTFDLSFLRSISIAVALLGSFASGQEKSSTDKVTEWKRAAEQGQAEAQACLGAYYANSEGASKAEAVKWFRKSAEQGNTWAQYNLGVCYAKGLGITKNDVEAVRWYSKAAERGDPAAQNNLGGCYLLGEGVPPDYSEAVKWFRKSAEQGNALAQNSIGSCYYSGKGVTKNNAEAVKWFRKAAEQGNTFAQNSLGGCYLLGEGVPPDYSEAVKWFRKSAEQGNALAQHCLGGCYTDGSGVLQNEIEGYKWTLLAANQGHEPAKKDIPIFESRLSHAQRVEGQRLAQEWNARHANSWADTERQITERKVSAISSFSSEAPESSFEKKRIHGGATIELPKSWAAVTDFNHNLDESMEAGLYGVDLRKFNINPAQNKTQLIAVGKFGESKTSVAIIYIDCKTYTQEQLASSSANEKTQVTSFLENQMTTIFDSQTKVSIDRVGPYEAIVARWEKISENMTMRFYQLPLGRRIQAASAIGGGAVKMSFGVA